MAATLDSIQQVISSTKSLAALPEIAESTRVELLQAAKALVASLEKPEDALTKIAYSVRPDALR